MRFQERIALMLAEMFGAATVAYHQLTPDQQQRIRMLAYRTGATICRHVAYKAGMIGISLERKYAEEGAANG